MLLIKTKKYSKNQHGFTPVQKCLNYFMMIAIKKYHVSIQINTTRKRQNNKHVQRWTYPSLSNVPQRDSNRGSRTTWKIMKACIIQQKSSKYIKQKYHILI